MDIVSLLRLLVNGLIEAEAKFFSNPKENSCQFRWGSDF